MKKEEINEIITDEFLKIYFQKYKLIPWSHLPEKIEQYLLTRYKDCNNIRESYYRICNNLNEVPKCEYCKENKVKWIGRSYTKCCCKECANKLASLNISNNIKNFSDEKKIEIIKKQKETCLLKYGEICPSKNIQIKIKQANTNYLKYGSKSPLQNALIQNKTINTNLKLYGVENYAQTSEWKNKVNNTSKIKYRTDYPNQSEIVKDKIKSTTFLHYGVDNYWKTYENKKKANSIESTQKAFKTKIRNGTINTSQAEKLFKEYLEQNYPNDFEYQYRSELYPFNCDFYIKSLDLYIEINGSWTHGGHPFDENNQEDIIRLNEMKSKNTQYYNNAIKTWTIRDVKKRNMAKQNNLNYLEIFSNNIYDIHKIFNNFINEKYKDN